MLTQEQLMAAIPNCLDTIELPVLGERISGKVRESYRQNNQRILITTDRVSAFDRVLDLIPYKGQVLNQLSAWWFEQTADIVTHHMVAVPDPNVMIAHEVQTLPIEVVVRGYITGVTSTSLWTLYEQGDHQPYGISLPDGLQKNDPLPHPIITPTTKAEHGHDERITGEAIIERGLVDADIWHAVQEQAIALFQRGQVLAEQAGMILVDTKYEFGLQDGTLMLIDEVHTPDSSRYWTSTSYQAGQPDNFSKEYLREWFKAQGYTGEGDIPTMPADFIAQVAERYITVYEKLTNTTFEPAEQPAFERIRRNLTPFAQSHTGEEQQS
ncbi:MAG: phosphoribosylaminoimidazolesuccinocarboxamide synthase [Anaerolineae bacterium]